MSFNNEKELQLYLEEQMKYIELELKLALEMEKIIADLNKAINN